MAKSKGLESISLTSYDDLFSTGPQAATGEQVQEIHLDQLFPFKNHPFKVLDDDAMRDTTESIEKYGVLVPAIARPRVEGGYELISGHRRCHASELAGKETMPVIVRDLDDDAATIIMVDSNLQRENILPSERAFAYKMKLDAMKRQAGRPSKENGGQVDPNLAGRKSRDILAEQVGESAKQISRYIRLTELVPELLDMVDEKKAAFNPAVELSYLKKDEQQMLLQEMDATQSTPSLSQAQRLKKFSHEGHLSEDAIMAIMSEEKKDVEKITLSGDQVGKYFPKSFTPKQRQDTIIKLLDQWQKKRQRDQER
ncbi:MAG: ParB/RepB/Spo0J family partition protein [Oscillospiraceae bacterium]|nr:ParB/RepB/Spo0J family partition protein [Oscillospiraceae bacterium]